MTDPTHSISFSDPSSNHTRIYTMTVYPPKTDYNDLIDKELRGVDNSTKVNEIVQYPTQTYIANSEIYGESYSYLTRQPISRILG